MVSPIEDTSFGESVITAAITTGSVHYVIFAGHSLTSKSPTLGGIILHLILFHLFFLFRTAKTYYIA